ncbi:Neurofibromin-like protein [Heterostelium album PN500]|uniref:Neurofibromin-like protein n=1 Tax=Heterostelium pallidum (strain ATCC 26659 / Pp 5 / PN500) TaxID=670386 RepID=D3AW84_HETP5|nr:Neurofibromin-like protein [Heterostelium album PN500]EFA86557.1 Neurofibromin-like protein [Heterostelium album PN500]|eukprot:XP_020438662.1 Neurofibromin-like protein [Heterostelium album PN500]
MDNEDRLITDLINRYSVQIKFKKNQGYQTSDQLQQNVLRKHNEQTLIDLSSNKLNLIANGLSDILDSLTKKKDKEEPNEHNLWAQSYTLGLLAKCMEHQWFHIKSQYRTMSNNVSDEKEALKLREKEEQLLPPPLQDSMASRIIGIASGCLIRCPSESDTYINSGKLIYQLSATNYDQVYAKIVDTLSAIVNASSGNVAADESITTSAYVTDTDVTILKPIAYSIEGELKDRFIVQQKGVELESINLETEFLVALFKTSSKKLSVMLPDLMHADSPSFKIVLLKSIIKIVMDDSHPNKLPWCPSLSEAYPIVSSQLKQLFIDCLQSVRSINNTPRQLTDKSSSKKHQDKHSDIQIITLLVQLYHLDPKFALYPMKTPVQDLDDFKSIMVGLCLIASSQTLSSDLVEMAGATLIKMHQISSIECWYDKKLTNGFWEISSTVIRSLLRRIASPTTGNTTAWEELFSRWTATTPLLVSITDDINNDDTVLAANAGATGSSTTTTTTGGSGGSGAAASSAGGQLSQGRTRSRKLTNTPTSTVEKAKLITVFMDELVELMISIDFKRSLLDLLIDWTTIFNPNTIASSGSNNNSAGNLSNSLTSSSASINGNTLSQSPSEPSFLSDSFDSKSNNNDLSCISLLSNILSGLIFNTNDHAGLMLFKKYFNIFFNQLTKKQPELLHDNKQMNDGIIQCICNMIYSNSNYDYFVQIGYHEEAETRAAFLQVSANVIKQSNLHQRQQIAASSGASAADLLLDGAGRPSSHWKPAGASITVSPSTSSLSLEDTKYQQFYELLLQAPDYHALISMSQINDSDELARALIYFYDQYDRTLPALKKIIQYEVSTTKSSSTSTLLRGNSLGSKMLASYIKMIGTPYLKQALGTPIGKILANNTSMEIDTTKLGPNDDIHANISRLSLLAKIFIRSIQETICSVPAPIRELSSYIVKELSQHHPGTEKLTVVGIMFLNYFINSLERLGKVLVTMGQPKLSDQIQSVLRTLSVTLNSIQPTAEGASTNSIVELLQRFEHTNIDYLKQKKLFYQQGYTLKDRQPVFYYIARRFDASMDQDHLFYLMLKTVVDSTDTNLSKDFTIVIDCTLSTASHNIPLAWCATWLRHLPPKLFANCSIYIVNPSRYIKSHFKSIYKLVGGQQYRVKMLLFLSNSVRLFEHIETANHGLPESTLAIETDVMALYTPVVKVNQFLEKNVTIRITNDHLQLISIKLYSLLGRSTQLIDTYPISNIKVLVSSNDTEEFELRFKSGGQSMQLKSPQRFQIVQSINQSIATSTASSGAAPSESTTSSINPIPHDIPGTLLNMALLNMGSSNYSLRTAAYNVIAAIAVHPSFSTQCRLLDTPGLSIPKNSTQKIVQISSRLSKCQPELTLDFMLEAMHGINKAALSSKYLVLEFMEPWISNLSNYTRKGQTPEQIARYKKTTDIIDLLIELTIRESGLKSIIHERVWICIGKQSEDLIGLVLQRCSLKSRETKNSEIIGEMVSSMGYTSPQPVGRKLIGRILKLLDKTGQLQQSTLQHSSSDLSMHILWTQITINLRLLIANSLLANNDFNLSTESKELEKMSITNVDPVAKSIFAILKVFIDSRFEQAKQWHMRWIQLTIKAAFTSNPPIQSRALITLGNIVKNNSMCELLIRDILKVLGSTLKTANSLTNYSDIIYSAIHCLTRLQEYLSPKSIDTFTSLFWIGMSFMEIYDSKIFSVALAQIESLIKIMDNHQLFAEGFHPTLLLARNPYLKSLQAIDQVVGVNFENNFAFAVSTHLLKGLKNASTKSSTTSLLSTILKIVSKKPIETSSMLGYLALLASEGEFSFIENQSEPGQLLFNPQMVADETHAALLTLKISSAITNSENPKIVAPALFIMDRLYSFMMAAPTNSINNNKQFDLKQIGFQGMSDAGAGFQRQTTLTINQSILKSTSELLDSVTNTVFQSISGQTYPFNDSDLKIDDISDDEEHKK